MRTKYEKAQARVTEKNPCGLTRRQRLRRWFWSTRVGVALNALLGRPTVYRATIEGCLIGTNNMLVVDCHLRPFSDTPPPQLVTAFRTKVSNG